ncbi:MAG: AraC family transcriptional regulator [Propionibacteriales bacterium]|nr:AraC family transcriptional regulator [Propionibacteriales bacterium]
MRTTDSTTIRTIPVRFLRAATSTATLRGVDLAEWMDHLDIDPALLFDDRTRITLDQATKTVQELWRLTGDELVGLGVQPAPRGTFRMICLGVISAPDLGTVLGRFQEFSRVLPSMPTFTISYGETSTQVTYTADPEYDPAHFITDIMMSVALRFFGWLAGRRLPIESVELPYPLPEGAEDYDRVFGSLVTFDRPAAMITFSNEMLTLPVVQDEASLEQWLRDSPADLLMLRDYGTTTADQVRRILERGLRGPWPTPDEAASQLSMSTQNMRRLLRDEGTSVTRIKEDLLRDAAVTALVRGDETVAQLAERLGFSEPSAFHRAFRRWTGSSPGAYRPDRG